MAVAHLCLVRRMLRIVSWLIIVAAVFNVASAQVVEKRGSVTYSASEWSSGDKSHIVPKPAGGMGSFLSHLDYPAALRRRHVAGTMRVRVSLDAAGGVQTVEVLTSVHPSLDAIVLRAVRHTRWTPARRDGKPIPCAFVFPVTFKRDA